MMNPSYVPLGIAELRVRERMIFRWYLDIWLKVGIRNTFPINLPYYNLVI